MFKKPNGSFDWLKLLIVIACVAVVVTMIVIPIVNKVKASIPTEEETEAVVSAARMLFKI